MVTCWVLMIASKSSVERLPLRASISIWRISMPKLPRSMADRTRRTLALGWRCADWKMVHRRAPSFRWQQAQGEETWERWGSPLRMRRRGVCLNGDFEMRSRVALLWYAGSQAERQQAGAAGKRRGLNVEWTGTYHVLQVLR